MTPEERANQVRAWLEEFDGVGDELVPSGSIILTAEDAHEIREAIRCAMEHDVSMCKIALEVMGGGQR